MQREKVQGRTILPDNSVIITHNENPILNIMKHNVEFEDGNVREFVVNIIVQNILTKTNDDTHVSMALETMLNHGKEDAAYDLEDRHFCLNSQRKLSKSAQGWDLQVLCQDGTTDWIPLEYLKKSNRAKVADHANDRKIDKEEAFKW